MTYVVAFLVFLALPAMAAAARITAHYRYGAHGRPDLESGRTGDLGPTESRAPARSALLQVLGDASGSEDRTKDGRPTLRPVFNLGATPDPEGVGPWASDKHIRREFDLDETDHRGRAA